MSKSSKVLDDLGDSIDHTTFEQIVEMDDDDEDFSRSIVFGFFEQAESTFAKMEEKIEQEDLEELSSLGHFLKGSSAIIGLNRIKESCEKIQHLGHCMDETGSVKQDPNICLRKIKREVTYMRAEYEKVKAALEKYFDGN